MRANKKVFWISLGAMLLSIVAIVLFTIFKCNIVCEVFLNIFISLVGGAFLSAVTAFVVFSTKRKEYIVTYCTEYIKVFNVLLDIQNWYSHWATFPDKKPNNESIQYVLKRFEDISCYDYSTMLMILDDYCALGFCLSKTGQKLKEMIKAVEEANYAYNKTDSKKFSLYRVNTYDENYMYEFFIKAKSVDINNLFFKMKELQSELLEISKINNYLNSIHKNAPEDNK